MKYAYLCLGLIMAGITGIVFIVLFQNVTVNNESEYYVLKEAMEAAMLESVDITCYRLTSIGENTNNECGKEKIKISEQKFVENFTRRFAESIGGNASNYKLEFHDIIESPPKATIVVKALTESGLIDGKQSFSIVNNLDGILEYGHIPGTTSISSIEYNAPSDNYTEDMNSEEIEETQETLPTPKPSGQQTQTND